MYMCIYIYIYIYTCMYVYIYIYIYMFTTCLSFDRHLLLVALPAASAPLSLYCFAC